MYYAEIFDGIHALLKNQDFAAYQRTGTIDECAITRVENSSAIEFQIDGNGSVQIDGNPTPVGAQSVELDPGHQNLPRRDVLWIDDTATLQAERGDPDVYKPARDPDGDGQNVLKARKLTHPAPDNMADVLGANGAPTGVVIATVLVPPGTVGSSQMTDDDWTERHYIVPSTAGSGSHDDLTDVSPSDHHTRPTAGENLEENSNAFDVMDVADGGTIDADSVDGYDIYVQNSPPSTNDPYLRFEDA